MSDRAHKARELDRIERFQKARSTEEIVQEVMEILVYVVLEQSVCPRKAVPLGSLSFIANMIEQDLPGYKK